MVEQSPHKKTSIFERLESHGRFQYIDFSDPGTAELLAKKHRRMEEKFHEDLRQDLNDAMNNIARELGITEESEDLNLFGAPIADDSPDLRETS